MESLKFYGVGTFVGCDTQRGKWYVFDRAQGEKVFETTSKLEAYLFQQTSSKGDN